MNLKFRRSNKIKKRQETINNKIVSFTYLFSYQSNMKKER